MQRYRFYTRFQGPTESSENFVLAVKLLAEQCNFGQFKETAIRDRLIMGLGDKTLQYKLLMEDDLSMEAVEKMIINSEDAGNRVRIMNEGSASNVHSVKHRIGRRNEPESHDNWHTDNRYRHRSNSRGRQVSRNAYKRWDRSTSRDQKKNFHANAICNYCKRKGHLKRDCFHFKKSIAVNSVVEPQPAMDDVAHYYKRMKVKKSSDEDNSDYECLMIKAVNSVSEPCLIKVSVNDECLAMEMDTGSVVSVIGKNTYYEKFSKIPLSNCTRRLVVVSGSRLKILGELEVFVSVNNKTAVARLIVLQTDNNFTPLIGRDWMDLFFPHWRKGLIGLEAVKQVGFEDDKEQLLGYEAELILKNDQPIFKRAYEVPYKIRDKLLNHLDMLEKQNVVTPIAASEWASPVIAVMKKDGDIRMVIDCKISLGHQTVTAHRNQLKLIHDQRRSSMVLMPFHERKRRRDSIELEDPFIGFPDVPHVPEQRETKKRKLISVARSPVITRSATRSKQEEKVLE